MHPLPNAFQVGLGGGREPILKGARGEACANRLDLSTSLLLSPNEITDVFAIVGVLAACDLGLDPVILVVRQRNSLADSSHREPPNMHQWCD